MNGEPRRIQAVLFDVDGTLYRQTPLRLLMALELGTRPVIRWADAPPAVVWNVVRIFREVREEFQAGDARAGDVVARLYRATAARAGAPEALVRTIVEEWLLRRPLKYLRSCRRSGLRALLAQLAARRVLLGVLSDYPPAAKLRALEVADCFAPVLCTTDPEIDALKPHPRGFLRACELWSVTPDEVLYVGDRTDTDAPGAFAAGMACALLCRDGRGARGADDGRKSAVHIRHLRDVARLVERL